MIQEPHPQRDIPPAVAIVILSLVCGLFVYLNHPNDALVWGASIDSLIEHHSDFLMLLILSLSMNTMGIAAGVSYGLGINRQGQRLQLLTQRPSIKAKNVGSFAISTLILIGGTSTAFSVLHFFNVPSVSNLDSLPLTGVEASFLNIFVQFNFAASIGIIALVGFRATQGGIRRTLLVRGLPRFPKRPNKLVLGSIRDEDPSARPEWVQIGRKALNGNILITGSIGSGKTQGTILNYFEQMLSTFEPRPSVLAIDPKGTFIPEALKIIQKAGLADHVLHLKLGGEVTFNPIFCDKPLKNAGFLAVSQMIRAAAINFSGRGTDSPFWELSAFSLMNGTLALTAAKHLESPFTLTDLYQEMIAACSDGLAAGEFLKTCAGDSKFDDEERFNLAAQAQYFLGFDQMDEKLRTGILATATAFLNQFQEYQAAKIFCPASSGTTLKTLDEVVDQGKFLLFDISVPGLARSMGTFVKLHYEQSVLNRLTSKHRGLERSAVLICDEYQDVVSTGSGQTIGDDRFCAKSREANAIALFATQSLTSIKNSVGKEDSAKELIQNFRTMISGHSTDLMTIHCFQELIGQEDKKKVSHSFSENAQKPSRNLISGGFDAKDANISESISTSQQREYSVTGREFSTLTTFETFARIYDGNQTQFYKMYLKPYFLEEKRMLHSKILKRLKSSAAGVAILLAGIGSRESHAFPNVCTIVKTPAFNSCLNFNVGACMCGWPVPRPCAQFSYYVPQTFIEAFPNPGESFFGDLPGATAQLISAGSKPYGAESDSDTQSFQAHALTVPLTMIPFELMPCGVSEFDRMCFGAMSEHLGGQWESGSGDSLQPNFLAWGLSPKACLLKGAATSITGEPGVPGLPATPACSFPLGVLPKYPPSEHSACNGWGTFYPRSGVYTGGSQAAGALMVASRLKSLGNEVFHTVSSSVDEEWQMITPQASSCFKEGQNVGILETIQGVREEQRLVSHQTKGFLFTVWNKVSCCRDLAEIPTALAAIATMNVTCQAMGAL